MSEKPEVENIEEIKDDDDVIIKPKKPKRVMSEKQSKQFDIARQTKADNVEARKKEKMLEMARLLIAEEASKQIAGTRRSPHAPYTAKDDESESESEYEEVMVKRKKNREGITGNREVPCKKVKPVVEKKVKKKKKITIEISDDSSSESDEEPPSPPPSPQPLTRKMMTQQNKKSVVKIHKPIEKQFVNIFSD